MRSAAEGLKQTISEAAFGEPLVPLMANVTADTLIDAETIKEELANQIIRCVRWQASVENMIVGGVTSFVEIGHGQVLADLIKRINPAVPVLNIGDVDIENQVEKWWAEHRREHIKGLVEKAIQSEK